MNIFKRCFINIKRFKVHSLHVNREEPNTETSINSKSVLKLHKTQKALLNFISDLIDTFQLSSLLGNSWVSLKPLKNHTVCTYMRSPPYLRYGSRSVDSLLPSATTYLFLGLVEPTTTTYLLTCCTHFMLSRKINDVNWKHQL